MKPKFSLGVRSHMLLILGVKPWTGGLAFVSFMPWMTRSVEFGLEWAEWLPRRMKSVRAACWGS